MIDPAAYRALPAARRAELIYGQARSEMSDRLWRAALGTGDAGADRTRSGAGDGMGFDALLALLDAQSGPRPAPTPAPAAAIPDQPEPAQPPATIPAAAVPPAPVAATTRAGLGPNARHGPALAGAAARTGIPVSALAAIVHAEAAKGRDGSWQAMSRNPRSSAAGLGQFLSGTWEGMAEARGTWLNDVARTRGWLDDRGQVLSGARSMLLQLRYDPAASIETTADYARRNLDGLARAGVAVGADAAAVARAAYLGHHLGLGDAIRFLKGGIEPARAKMLLGAQVGAAQANARIAEAGNAAAAHRAWFLGFVDRHVQPQRFSG